MQKGTPPFIFTRHQSLKSWLFFRKSLFFNVFSTTNSISFYFGNLSSHFDTPGGQFWEKSLANRIYSFIFNSILLMTSVKAGYGLKPEAELKQKIANFYRHQCSHVRITEMIKNACFLQLIFPSRKQWIFNPSPLSALINIKAHKLLKAQAPLIYTLQQTHRKPCL